MAQTQAESALDVQARGTSTVPVTVCFWDRRRQCRALRAALSVPVEAGAPVIWAFGRFVRRCAKILDLVFGGQEDLTFELEGSEAFWFTPVARPAVLHVYRDVGRR